MKKIDASLEVLMDRIADMDRDQYALIDPVAAEHVSGIAHAVRSSLVEIRNELARLKGEDI
jgi:hypothetical protein